MIAICITYSLYIFTNMLKVSQCLGLIHNVLDSLAELVHASAIVCCVVVVHMVTRWNSIGKKRKADNWLVIQ